MLWLYILLGILLVIFLLMTAPVKLRASYDNDFICKLTVGFIPFTIYPQKPKKKKKPAKPAKKQAPKPKEEKKSLIKEKGLTGLIELINRIIKLAKGALKDFFKHIIVKRLMLSVSVAGSDAADTAVKYGYCCSAVYPAFGVLINSLRCKKYGVDVTPDFEEGAKTAIKINLEARTRIFWLVKLVLKHGIKALRLLAELK